VVDAIDTQLMQATKAHQEEFTRRLHAFNQLAAKQSNGEHAKPTGFLQSEGLSAHERSFLEVLQTIFMLQKAGVPRSAVQRCMNQWVKSVWSGEYDESVCMSFRPKDEPAPRRYAFLETAEDDVQVSAGTASSQERALQHDVQTSAGTASSQEQALKQPRELSSNDGRTSSKAAALHVPGSLLSRQTTPWQIGEGPVLRSVGNTNGETPNVDSKTQANDQAEIAKQAQPSDLPRGTNFSESVPLQQILTSRSRHGKVRVDGCICRFALLLIGFASGWMSFKLQTHNSPGWSAGFGPPKVARICFECGGGCFTFKDHGIRKSSIVFPRGRRRVPL